LSRKSTSRSIWLVVIIVAAAASLSFVSYQYSTLASTQIFDIAGREAKSTAAIQAHDLSAVLANKIESVSTNLQLMADAPMIQNQNVQGAIPLFTAARKSTGDFASSYFWIDKDGILIWADSFTNKTIEQQYNGGDRSYRDYYLKPKETMLPYYTTVIESVDNVPRLYIGYPIIGKQAVGDGNGNNSSDSSFEGVVAASINLDTLGKFVQDQLITDYKSTAGLLDRNGIILFSSNSPQFVGKSIFGPEVQSVIPEDAKQQFNKFMQDSLTGKSGSEDLTSEGSTSTIAYRSVTIQGNEAYILFVTTPHEFAGSVIELVDQQKILNLITVIAIGALAATVATVVLVWNKRLSKVVTARTSELRISNQSLIESNKQLQAANTLLGEANEQLQVHDRLQREFVNIAAHELRTPIQPLLAAAELLETQFRDSEEIKVTRPEIDMILRNAKRLERLSSDILEISRIDSGALKLNKENFSLAYIIADAIKDAKAQSIFDPGKVMITYYPDDIFIYADKDKITQVMTNLLANAIKFTKEGTISITTERDEDNKIANVTIKDTGSGIDPEVLPKMFKKFVTKSEKGTGIGLYISKKIVEAHGGTILGENNPDGQGAAFKFTVPLVEKDVQEGTSATGSHSTRK
jgi:signal transduction histidine kinase